MSIASAVKARVAVRGDVARVQAYLDGLETEGRALPSHRGVAPRMSAIARDAGVQYHRLIINREARTLLDGHGRAHGYEPDLGTKYVELKRSIVAYARAKRLSGGTVPRDPKFSNRVSHVGVAREMGVDYRACWASVLTVQCFATQQLAGIPLGDPYLPASKAGTNSRDVHRARMDSWDAHLRATYEEAGCPVPESLQQAGIPNYNALKAEHPGIVITQLMQETPLRQRLHETIARVGLAPRRKPVALRVTYDDLLAFAYATRLAETKDTQTSEQAARNVVSAGRGLMVLLGREGTDHCDIDLVNDLAANVDAIVAATENANTARKLRQEVTALAGYHRLLLHGRGLPATLPEALKELVVRAGVTASYVDRRLGLVKGTFLRWASGDSGLCHASVPVLTAIEGFFEVPPGSLTGLLPTKLNGRRSLSRDGGTLSELHTVRVVRHLPADFRDRTPVEQAAIVADVNGSILRQARPYSTNHAILSRQPYRLKCGSWPDAARAEWAALVEFKTSDLPPIGMERAGDSRWEAGSTEMNHTELERLYGFATLSEEEGGLGLETALVGLWMLATEAVVQRYIEWRKHRRGGALNRGDTKFLNGAASLLRDLVGFLPQRPEIAKRMVAGDTTLTASETGKARADWRGHCARAESRFRRLVVDIKAHIKKDRNPEARRKGTRDPFEPIAGLLALERPMTEYRRLQLKMEGRCPDVKTAPAYHHQHKRDCVLARLLRLLCFRSKNMLGITWRKDGTGQLRKVDGAWVITVPRREFKNQDSPFFGPPGGKGDYHRVLKNADDLYALLDYYVDVSRPFLMDGTEHDVLLVTHGGSEYDCSTFYRGYRSITERHFAHNPHIGRGLPGLMPHGPHAVRHIMATHVVKTTGRFDLAGASIQDTEESARKCYVRFLPTDAHNLLTQCFDEIDGLGPGGSVAAITPDTAKLTAEIRMLRAELAGSRQAAPSTCRLVGL